MRRILLPFLLIASSLSAQQTSVLFIGNSYTYVNDLPNTFRQLALSLGDTVTVAMSAPGGYTLQQHTTYAPTLDAISSQPWDFVVLQEQSQLGALPVDVTSTESSAIVLAQNIEANYECTYPVFYMTWGHLDGDPDNCANWPEVCTYEGMQAGLRANYVGMADYNNGYTAPVGVAWKQVRDTHPAIGLYQADGSHPTAEGTYLAACVFYSTLFQASSVGATFHSTLPSATAAILQGIASSVVLDSTLVWNLDVPNGTDAHITGSSSDAPDEITFYHPGQGTHWWSCSDGQTSSEENPTFYFDTPGTYTMTHAYTDPCGNSDTVSWTIEVYPAGIADVSTHIQYQVRPVIPSALEVTGGTGAETLTIIDPQGRTVLTRRLDSDHVRVPCPAGLYAWRIRDRLGTVRCGKVIVQ